MRIIFFSHYYPPEVNAPAPRTSDPARIGARPGHDVTIVTCTPNHPDGEAYPGYANKLWQEETIDGVKVVRVWTFLAANEGFALRALNYASYMFSACQALLKLKRPDVIVSTSPQFFCGLAGLIAQAYWKRPWALEVRDLWPESIVTVGAMGKGKLIEALERIESLAYRRANKIISVTDSFVPHIAARGGANKVVVIKNGANLELFTPSNDDGGLRARLGLEGRFIGAYVGTLGMAHGLDTILQAAALLRDDPRIAFLLVGGGAEREQLERRKAEMALDNVVLLGQQPKDSMPRIWAATDVSLILLRRNDLFKKVLPSKMFEAMAMRRPIILGVEGEAQELLREAGAAISITPESAEELAAAMKKLADDRSLGEKLGASGCAFVNEHYNRTKLAAQYIEALEETAKAPACDTDVSCEKIEAGS